ncbi:MAG: hypothetical protein MRZ49_07915 [Lachnospiraceae bacterium]|nr:hypothetical protein [Lachnospiraceae bacterium]
MKKIINNKLYNTDTATLIGEYENGYSCSDFCHMAEYLYKKRTNEYFLYGTGGPLSKYGERIGNEMCGGSVIIPLSDKVARAWAMKHMDADEFINAFGDVEE